MEERIVKRLKEILNKELKLLEIKKAKNIIFVGDTHGDVEVSKKIIKKYLIPENKIVFLGDYVDRGTYSRENLDFLLEKKVEFSEQIYLLQGNHEGHRILRFSPADFWKGLPKDEYEKYSTIVEKLSLAVVAKDIIALHGVLPDIKNLEEINQIESGGKEWLQITWGDFIAKPGKYLGIDPLTGRPLFGRNWFFELMERFNKKVLIRSHQPDAPEFMFDNKCLTIFTSCAYHCKRTIAVLDFKKEIKTAKDLQIIKI